MSEAIIACRDDVRVKRVFGDNDLQVTMEIAAGASTSRCPECGTASGRVHSVYVRTLRDAPWREKPVVVRIWVRKFFCDVPTCLRTIFCERLAWAPVYQRRTQTFTDEVTQIGFATNAETAARTANRLGLPVSPDTVLRCLRAAPEPESPKATVIGIDDWSIRKGQTYGTLIVDLESHRPIDVLEGRDAATVAAWLKDHPEVTVVSRDRASAYAKGVREGRPEAKQVADRFHLLQNLGDDTVEWLKAHPWSPAAVAPSSPPAEHTAGPATPMDQTIESGPGADCPSAALSPGDERRAQRWQAVRAMHEQGQSLSAIARALDLDRHTVRKYLLRPDVPVRPHRVAPHLASWQPVLEELYTEGARTFGALWNAAQAKGYPGAKSTLYAWFNTHHPRSAAPERAMDKPEGQRPRIRLSAREWAQACMMNWPTLPRRWNDLISERLAEDPGYRESGYRAIWRLTHQFHTLVRHRKAGALDAWQRQAGSSGIAFLARFAKNLDKDREAVDAGCTEPFSQGPVEGLNTRTKFLKRLMYGRAKFDLLRRRILHAS